MSKQVTKADVAIIVAVMGACAIIVNSLILTDEVKPLTPPEYNLLCKKNFDMPSKFNVVLECMHIRTKGN